VEGRRRSAQGAMSHAGRVAAGAGSSEPRAGRCCRGGRRDGASGRHGRAGLAGSGRQGGAGGGGGGARRAARGGRRGMAWRGATDEEQRRVQPARSSDGRRGAAGWARKRRCRYFKNVTSESRQLSPSEVNRAGPSPQP
jgi:hypothetical protein